MDKPLNIEGYISGFPGETQKILEQMRSIIKTAAPGAQEVISYSMPAFKLNGILVWFAAHSRHIGFYPTGSGIAVFAKELSGYKVSKGTVQFPYEKPLPIELIKKIVEFRVQENLDKIKTKKK